MSRGRQDELGIVVIIKLLTMKKFSLVSNENIRKHLANTSPAKITHSFSKSRRFLDPNPEYPDRHSDAKRPITAAQPHFPNVTAALVSAAGPISPRVQLSLLLHLLTASLPSLINSVKRTPSESAARNLPNATTFTTFARLMSLAQAL